MKLQARVNCNLIEIHLLLLWEIGLGKIKLVCDNNFPGGNNSPKHENKNTIVDFKSE